MTKVNRKEATMRMREIEKHIVDGVYDPSNGGTVSVHTFAQAVDSYIQWKRTEGKSLDRAARNMSWANKKWGMVRLETITSDEIVDWISDTMGHLKPGSVARYLTSFKSVMRHAHSRGWLKKVPHIPMPKVDDARDQHLETDEVAALLEWVGENEPHYLLHFTLLIDTGARLGEVWRLAWRDIKNGVVKVKKMTHGKAVYRRIPMSRQLKDLADVHRGENDAPVITRKGGVQWRNANSASAMLNTALKAGCKAIGSEPMRVHDLRHTFAYLAAQAGADLGDLQLLMGHERLDMTLRYRGFIPNRSRDVIQNLRP